MNRQLYMPDSLRKALAKVAESLTETERIMLRNKMAKLVVIDGKVFLIDMVMIDKGESDGRRKV